MSEMETPEAGARALLLVDACGAYSRGDVDLDAYPRLLGRTAAELRGDQWETLKTLHAFGRTANTAVKLAASDSLRSEEAIHDRRGDRRYRPERRMTVARLSPPTGPG